MAAEFGLYYPPWNHTGKPDDLLDRVAGEVGIDHVTIPVVTGEQVQFRLTHLGEGPYFHTEGGWHFPPCPNLYHTSVRAAKARWFGKRDVAASICERANALGVLVFFRLELTAVPKLADYEHLRRRNAWGQDICSAPPCVFNSELRELLRAITEDLMRYRPAGFQLGGWLQGGKPGWTRLRHLPPRARAELALPNLCFCPACRQIAAQAGVDPEQAARSVRAHLERIAAAPPGHPGEKDENDDVLKLYRDERVEADQLLTAYEDSHVADNWRWLTRLAEAHPAARWFYVSEYVETPGTELIPTDWKCLAKPPFDIVSDVWEWESIVGGPLALRVAGMTLPTWRPAIQEGTRLVKLVVDAKNAGVRFFDFEGLDESPHDAITWLKQAVRYARRG